MQTSSKTTFFFTFGKSLLLQYYPTSEEQEILQNGPSGDVEDDKMRRVVAYQRQQINQLLSRLEQAERQLFTVRIS